MERLFFCAVALTVFCLAALAGAVAASRTSRAAARRLGEVMHRTGERPERSWWHPNVRKASLVFVHWIRVRVGLSEDETLRPRLAQAGHRGNGPVDVFLASRVLTPFLAIGIAALIPYNRLLLLVIFPVVAFLLPDMVLHRMVKARREKIRRSIPDAVDLLVICVDAGLGIDQAVLRVSQELTLSHPEITEELLQINREQRAGKPRNEAWKEMADRIGLPEIMAFASMLTQTERFGTPISRALRSFSDGIRQRRRQVAEEMAAKTTVKIVFPLVFFIFPSIFIVLLGPAILTILRSMSGLGN